VADQVGVVFTIGHSTLPSTEFSRLMTEHQIGVLVDVRSLPGSRRYPQFDAENMPVWLPRTLEYRHCAALGGRRGRQDVDPGRNAGWHNASFKNYADYTLSAEYQDALVRLAELARRQRVTLMCAEALPWRCHRSLIADSLVANGWSVQHIVGHQLEPHRLGRWGPTPLVVDGVVSYPADPRAVPPSALPPPRGAP
jgi:uncharacterized protein (DUF488 family)